MIVFRIKASSWIIYGLTSLTITFVGMFIGIYLGKTNGSDVYIFMLLITGLTALVFIPDLLSTATQEWVFTEEGIQIKWLSQFILHKKPEISIKWKDIEEYKYEPARNFNLFKIKLHDQTIVKFWHSNYRIGDTDDFDAFLSYFEDQVNEYNEKDLNILYAIKRRKTIYETKLGITLAILVTLCLIAIPILYDAFPPRKINWISLSIGYSAGIYFISQVISHRKKERKKEANITLTLSQVFYKKDVG